MSDLLTLDEFAKLTGEQKKRLEQLRDAGLIGRDGAFQRWDAARVRLIHELIHHGFTIDGLAEASNDPKSSFNRYMEHLSERWLRRTFTVDEVAKAVGIESDIACRLLDAGGLREQEEMLDQDDILFFRSCKMALRRGLSDRRALPAAPRLRRRPQPRRRGRKPHEPLLPARADAV